MEFFELLWLNLVVAFRNCIEYGRVVYRYYGNRQFALTDLYLLSFYLLRSPFRISKRFLTEKKAEDVYAYGETPLTTMDFIAKQCAIHRNDIVYELGSGRGRACFWLNAFIGCKVIGIEFIPLFVEIAHKVKNKFHLKNVSFLMKDMLEASLEDATVIYLYGTCYDEQFIQNLIHLFASLPQGTRIISVSYSLEEFGCKEFPVIKTFSATFTWGIGQVYCQVKK